MRPYDDSRPKKDQVRDMFDNIAPAYDRLNHLLSMGIDRRWREKAVRSASAGNPGRILDLATGTGDMAIALAMKNPVAQITGADLSPQMLEEARRKIEERDLGERIALQQAEAEHLPFGDGEFDVATVAFGVRNFYNIPAGLREINRVLKKGGRVCILEFSTPENKIFGTLYRLYFHKVLPIVGGMVSKDYKAYSYLPHSVDEFPRVEVFTSMLEEAGFAGCRAKKMTGGVAWIWCGEKA